MMSKRLSDIPTDELRLWFRSVVAEFGESSQTAAVLRHELARREQEPTDWINMRHAAELIGVPYSLLRRMVEAGMVPCDRLGTGDIRFHRPDLLRWLRSMEGTP